MRRSIEITIPGKPLPKGRPRVVNGKAYTDPKTRGYETFLKMVMRDHASGFRWKIPSGDVFVKISLRFGSKIHGDLDNCAKSILDAANGVLFRDDKSVRILHIQREWATEDHPEGLTIYIDELPDDPMPKHRWESKPPRKPRPKAQSQPAKAG